MTNSAPRLEPCPFCGGRAQLLERPIGRRYVRVRCTTCMAMSAMVPSEEKAASVWNRRTDPATGKTVSLEIENASAMMTKTMWSKACDEVRDAQGSLCVLAIAHSDGELTIGLYPYGEEEDDM